MCNAQRLSKLANKISTKLYIISRSEHIVVSFFLDEAAERF